MLTGRWRGGGFEGDMARTVQVSVPVLATGMTRGTIGVGLSGFHGDCEAVMVYSHIPSK